MVSTVYRTTPLVPHKAMRQTSGSKKSAPWLAIAQTTSQTNGEIAVKDDTGIVVTGTLIRGGHATFTDHRLGQEQ